MDNPMTKSSTKEEEYFNKARDWEASRVAGLEKSERIAWNVAKASLAVFVLSVVAIVVMLPLKKTIPYLVTVDSKTGVPDVVSILDPKTISENEALNKHFLYTYALRRERYNWYTLQEDYDTVLQLSSPNTSREFAGKYEGPDALDKKNGKSIQTEIKVISVVPTSQNTATIRFQKISKREGEDGLPIENSKWIATAVFQYVGEPAKESERSINPLGFKVLSYRVDPELGGVQ